MTSAIAIFYPLSSTFDPQLFRRGVSHIGALWYIPADTKSQNILSQTEKLSCQSAF